MANVYRAWRIPGGIASIMSCSCPNVVVASCMGKSSPVGRDLPRAARQKECQIIEGHVMPDHVHMCIAIPPKVAVAQVIGFLKGKSAIAIA